ncbi:MptD family putative ECF transporter S component [Fusibacter sp. 3D3]|uniref:MptD family putative ECF transporter S component n=1 Tax=Fusibacter sp. 3D3 TaxID=1048380 RepID=UPI000853D4C6|nr:MptD family putative ECF transporter S component [Fusibacter sp. 3D3]GAU75838.1 substrate-specific component BL0695 of predicted ECF transporter [Fusibacter sp. 3D3]
MKQQKSELFQIKDFILIGVLSAVFFAVYMVIAMVTAMASPVVHIFSPAINGIVGGIIYLLLISKIPKKGVFTISTIIVMVLFQFTGGGYLPWFITTLLSAVIADLICMPTRYSHFKSIALGFGIMITGQALGNVIPVVIFAESFRNDFISRGVDPAFLDPMIQFIEGPMSIVILVISFAGGVFGMLLGKRLLNKHFKKAGIV